MMITGFLSRLQGVRQVGSNQWMALCPSHDDRNASLAVSVGQNGSIIVHCHAGCSDKQVLAVMGLSESDLFPSGMSGKSFSRSRRRGSRHKSKPAALPVLDEARAMRLIDAACANIEQLAVRMPWLHHRGVSFEVVRALRVGFLLELVFAEWPGWQLGPAWVLPITDGSGKIIALKLHREFPQSGPKALWAPFGTTTKPGSGSRLNGFSTLWPPPELFAPVNEGKGGLLDDVDRTWLNLLPGELKALAVLSAGQAATSITPGEGFRWTPAFVKRLAPFQVRLIYDDDAAGAKFRDATIRALRGRVVDLKAISFGRKAQTQ